MPTNHLDNDHVDVLRVLPQRVQLCHLSNKKRWNLKFKRIIELKMEKMKMCPTLSPPCFSRPPPNSQSSTPSSFQFWLSSFIFQLPTFNYDFQFSSFTLWIQIIWLSFNIQSLTPSSRICLCFIVQFIQFSNYAYLHESIFAASDNSFNYHLFHF